MTLRMTVFKDGQPFARTSPDPAVLVQVGPASYLNANTFEAGTFPPGKYKMICTTVMRETTPRAADAAMLLRQNSKSRETDGFKTLPPSPEDNRRRAHSRLETVKA